MRVLVRPKSNLACWKELAVEPVEGDLRDGASLERAMQGVRRVYHVAADYRLWTPKPADIYESNVEGHAAICWKSAHRAGVERIVYTSTVATIAVPRHGALPNEETWATLDEMIGHYKRSKFLAEQVALDAANAGVPVVIVNPTAPVGPGDWKPTPTGRIILDFLKGKMPAYVDTGLERGGGGGCCRGAFAGGGERARRASDIFLGARNMTLKQILDALAAIAGVRRRACDCRMRSR